MVYSNWDSRKTTANTMFISTFTYCNVASKDLVDLLQHLLLRREKDRNPIFSTTPEITFLWTNSTTQFKLLSYWNGNVLKILCSMSRPSIHFPELIFFYLVSWGIKCTILVACYCKTWWSLMEMADQAVLIWWDFYWHVLCLVELIFQIRRPCRFARQSHMKVLWTKGQAKRQKAENNSCAFVQLCMCCD